MTIVRTLTRADVDAAADLTARVFAGEGEYQAMFDVTRAAYLHCPFMPPELCWAALVGDRMVAKWQILDFQLRIGSTPIRMGGIQGVVAEPDENHKGYPRLVAERGLPEVMTRGFDLLLGFAQRGAFYMRLGAVPVTAEYYFEMDARALPRLSADPFRLAGDGDVPAVIDHYNASNQGRSGSLVRTPEHWPWMVRKPPEVWLAREGYIGIRWGPDYLEVRELGGRGAAFHEAAVRKLGELARAAGHRRIFGAVPCDHPLVETAVAYGAETRATYTRKSGCLALALDPTGLVEKLRGELAQRLQASRYREHRVDLCVRCEGREARLTFNPESRNVEKLEFSFGRGALLQLVFGYRPARALLADEEQRQLNGGSGSDPADAPGAELLDVLFPHGHPFMWQPDRF